MDMNQLFHHHQMALISVCRARRDGGPGADFDLPNHYARRIDAYRAKRGMNAYFPKKSRIEQAKQLPA